MDTIPEISTPEVTEEVTTQEVTTKEVTEEEVNYDGWDDEDTTSTEPEEVVVDKVKVDEPKEEVKEEVEETTETKPEPFDYGSLPLKILKDGDRTDAKLSDFTADEIITNFQKGTNYDRLNDQMQIFKDIAKVSNLPLAKVGDALLNDMFTKLAIKNKTTANEERLKFDKEKADAQKKLDDDLKKSEATNERLRKEHNAKMWNEFSAEYKDIKEPKDVPKEVWEYMSKNNASLLSSYQAVVEMPKLRESESKLKKQLENLKSSPVKSVTTNGDGGSVGTDPLYDGWDD